MIIHILRPDDLLNLHIETVNLKLDKENPQCPVLVSSGTPSFLIVHFTPQNIAEQAFYDDSPGQTSQTGTLPPSAGPPPPPHYIPTTGPTSAGTVAAVLGGPSRLVFLVPNNIQIPFTIEGLLDWSKLELYVSPIADVPKGGSSSLLPSDPKGFTMIELPYRLQISPTHTAVWDHALKPVSDKGRTEIWHTRLART